MADWEGFFNEVKIWDHAKLTTLSESVKGGTMAAKSAVILAYVPQYKAIQDRN